MKKIKHFFHALFVTYLVVSIIFSGMPFEGIIRHLREGNIVDVMYHAQKNGNVIDTALNEFVAPKIPQAYANGTTDAMMTYDTLNGTSTPKIRLWGGSSWGAETSATPFNGTEIYHMMLKYAPTRDEAILVALTNNGQVQAQVWNGSTWGSVTVLSTVSATNPNGISLYRGFDIEYEQSSGDAIVVAGDGTADPNYYVWNGSSWGSGVDINIPTTGVPYWIQLASKPGADDLAMIVLDSNSDVYGMRWSGTAWDNMAVATVWDAAAAIATREVIDVAYEKTSGDIMFLWGDSVAADDHNYRIYSGTTLGAITALANANAGGQPNWVRLASNPTSASDQIMLGTLDSAADLSTYIWSGTAWSAVHTEHSAAVENLAVERDFEIVFETHSSNPDDAWLLWSDGATVSRKLWNGPTSAWGAATTAGDDNMGIVLNAHPNNGAVLAGLYEDDTSVTDDIREFELTGGSQTWAAIAQIWAGPTRRNLGVIRMAQSTQSYNSSTEAMWAYVTEDSTANPQYRTWNGSAWGSPASASGTNGELRHMVLKTSPKRDEAMLVTLGNNGRVEAQAWNGSTGVWGSASLLNTVSNVNGNRDVQSLYRGFDIEYEQSSGDAIVVTGDGTADPNYWVWNGSSWTGPVDINIPTTGIPTYIKLASKSGTDELAMIVLDANSDVYGMRWTGSAWDNMGTAAAWETTASVATREAIDVAYEKTSGDILFAWGFATVATAWFRYRTYVSTTLGAVTNVVNANNGGVISWLRLASNPTAASNQIMIGGVDAGADLNTFIWDGTAWSAVHAEHSATVENITSRIFDIAFETHSSNANVAWLTWGDSATLSRKRWAASAWGTATTQGDDTGYIDLAAQPNSGTLFMAAYEDSTSASLDITENRVTGGTTFNTASAVFGGPVVRTGLSHTLVDVEGERYILPTYTQQAYRLFANANSTDVGSPLAAQDTAGTLATAGDAFRLRSLVRVDGNDLLTNGRPMKLQFAQQSGTCDTAFTGETYADVTGATVIAYKDNATPADEASLTANANDPTDGGRTIVNQSYQELNNFNNSAASILNGQDGKWDFSLYDNGAPTNTAYCFRMVQSNGTLLTYTTIPQITTAAGGGALSIDIVDSGGTPVGSPSMSMNSVVMSLGFQTATGTFGVSAQRVRVNNTTGNAQWSASIAADTGVTAFWNGVLDYDFNDPTANAGDGGDADSLGGRMNVDASVGTLAGTCSTTGITKGSSAGFSQGVTDSITLLTAGGTADTGCYWDFTGVAISQTIPGEQSTDNYSIAMTLTVVAI